MELVQGESLRQRLECGPMAIATGLDLAEQVAEGLTAAHAGGVVHRDLKPENVMITPDGVVKLLDFGLAKIGTDADASLVATSTFVTCDGSKILGTPEYMSPEQATGEPLDARSDVFSFGILLYEILAGVRPFARRSLGAVLIAVARDPAPPLRESCPDVDEATADLVMRCLAKAPEVRFAHAGEVVAALQGLAR
jgi:serine/threonine-protein kinase